MICPTTAIKNSEEKYIVSLFLAAIQLKYQSETGQISNTSLTYLKDLYTQWRVYLEVMTSAAIISRRKLLPQNLEEFSPRQSHELADRGRKWTVIATQLLVINNFNS